MFCPSCKDEFRPGFTRCQSCDVDLVEDLTSVPIERPAAGGKPGIPRALPMADYCGFVSLDEARKAREELKAARIHSEIVIRETPEALEQNPLGEEYWLRVEADQYRRAAPILGFDSAEEEQGESKTPCPGCGESVGVEATFCAKCGLRFEER